jgi:hypothetical protein
LKKIIDSGLPIKDRDMNVKDPEFIRKLNILSRAVKVEEPYWEKNKKTEIPTDYIEEVLLGNDPTPGRILIEEYYKVLYLNNQDPEKYNFTYWEKYFGVRPQTLRNIFNYVFFPIPDEKNPTEIDKILYFQDVEYEKRRKMIAEMTNEEYQTYLENTESRPELQESSRLDYLTFQATAKEPRTSDRTVMTDYLEEDRRDEMPLAFSPVIKEIDNRISELVKGQLDGPSKLLIEKDVQMKLEELKTKRIEFENKEKMLNESNTGPAMSKEEIEKELERIKNNPLKKKEENSSNKDGEK